MSRQKWLFLKHFYWHFPGAFVKFKNWFFSALLKLLWKQYTRAKPQEPKRSWPPTQSGPFLFGAITSVHAGCHSGRPGFLPPCGSKSVFRKGRPWTVCVSHLQTAMHWSGWTSGWCCRHMVEGSLASRTAFFTIPPNSWRCTCPGIISIKELQIPMNGFAKSSSFTPQAFSKLLCGALSNPFLIVSLRMTDLWSNGLRLDFKIETESACGQTYLITLG